MIKIIFSSLIASFVGAYLLLSLFFGGCSNFNTHAKDQLGLWKQNGSTQNWQCVESFNPFKNKKC
tara:strand:+ start:253 stop:447 length:195 start_codon:yes stop_codon:yes gene_type:complete